MRDDGSKGCAHIEQVRRSIIDSTAESEEEVSPSMLESLAELEMKTEHDEHKQIDKECEMHEHECKVQEEGFESKLSPEDIMNTEDDGYE